MKFTITRKRLTDTEISELVEEIRMFPDLVYISPSCWRKFVNPYCLLVNGQLAGVCAIYSKSGWVKIGPLVLRQHYHKKGLGKKLLHYVIQDNANKFLFITSSHQSVKNTVESYGFQKITHPLLTPNILLLFASHSLSYLHARLFTEWIRKKSFFRRGTRNYYVKNTTNRTPYGLKQK